MVKIIFKIILKITSAFRLVRGWLHRHKHPGFAATMTGLYDGERLGQRTSGTAPRSPAPGSALIITCTFRRDNDGNNI
jgi:hypothetical protein